MMRTLILTCNTGGGHNACAKAIQERFQSNGAECDIEEALSFVSEKVSRFTSWGHTTMYRHIPGLFHRGYGFAERHPKVLQNESSFYRFLTKGIEELYSLVCEKGYDSIICTHVFSGLLVGSMLRNYPIKLKTGFIATDYTCSPGTAASELDFYFIPHESLSGEFAAEGIPENKIVVSGIPVMQDFHTSAAKSEAKQKYGISAEKAHLLMMCGSMGCGPMIELTEGLVQCMDQSFEVSIVCGTNKKLKQELDELCHDIPQINVHGYVNDMVALMDSADLFLTKPGGLSVTEAAAKKLPMVFVDAVAGCEEYNLNFFLERNCAVTAQCTDELVSACVSLLNAPDTLHEMSDNFDGICKAAATEIIYSYMYQSNI